MIDIAASQNKNTILTFFKTVTFHKDLADSEQAISKENKKINEVQLLRDSCFNGGLNPSEIELLEILKEPRFQLDEDLHWKQRCLNSYKNARYLINRYPLTASDITDDFMITSGCHFLKIPTRQTNSQLGIWRYLKSSRLNRLMTFFLINVKK